MAFSYHAREACKGTFVRVLRGVKGRSMTEAPRRYCGNCGNELNPEDQFCQNCGTPVPQAATVPTPEADVPVPPPPPQTGTAAPPPQQAVGTQRSWPRRHPLLTGCLGLVGVFFLLVFALVAAGLGGGGGGGGGGGDQVAQEDKPRGAAPADDQKKEPEPEKEEPQDQQDEAKPKPKPKPKPEYKVGQTAKVANVEWEVSDAYLTNQLKSSFGTQKQGRFVVVDFTFTNNRNEEVTLDPDLHMILKDSQGRKFGADPDALEFVPTDLFIFLEPVNPGVSTDGRVIYEVPPDAQGFTLKLDDVELMEEESAVFDLSNIPQQAYEASATATATASPGP